MSNTLGAIAAQSGEIKPFIEHLADLVHKKPALEQAHSLVSLLNENFSQQSVTFLARNILDGTVKNQKVLVGSPIYIALSDTEADDQVWQ